MPPGREIRHRRPGPAGEIPGRHGHGQGRVAIEGMGTAGLLVRGGLGREHGQAGIDLPRIDIDHRPAKGLGQGQGGGGLARARGAQEADHPDRAHDGTSCPVAGSP